MTATSENVYAAPEIEQQPSGNPSANAAGCLAVIGVGILLLSVVLIVVFGFIIPEYRKAYANPKFKKGQWVKVSSGFYRDRVGVTRDCSQDYHGNFEYGVDPINTGIERIAERDLTACDPPKVEPVDVDAQQIFDWRTYPHPMPRRVQ